jgi:hypothetical protein
VPAERSVNAGGLLDRTAFRYDTDNDCFVCPEGRTLKRMQLSRKDRAVYYGAQAADCAACPQKSQCLRHFGLFANRRRATTLARCRQLLGAVACTDRTETTTLPRCPACSATMLVIERFTSAQLYFRPDRSLANPQRCNLDSS